MQVALYADGDIDSYPTGDFPGGVGDIDWDGDGVVDGDDNVVDDTNRNGRIDYADVDNYPLGNFPGPEDVNHCPAGSAEPNCTSFHAAPATGPNYTDGFDYGDALQVVWSDSWDDSLPTGCQGETYVAFPGTALETPTDCFDGLRNFNQIRPAVFDGGFAFDSYDLSRLPGDVVAKLNAFYAQPRIVTLRSQGLLPDEWLLPGDYIVESPTPPGYELVKEEDRNVDFGDEFVPAPQALEVVCVGEPHTVPPLFSMVTKDGSGEIAQVIDGVDPERSRQCVAACRHHPPALRPQEGAARLGPERSGQLLPDDRRAGCRQCRGHDPERPGQRVRSDRALVR